MIDDEGPRERPKRVPSPPLAGLGVAELGDYIADLRAEIARAQAEIERKEAHRSAAAAFFKSAE